MDEFQRTASQMLIELEAGMSIHNAGTIDGLLARYNHLANCNCVHVCIRTTGFKPDPCGNSARKISERS